jgi:hypothetical protein
LGLEERRLRERANLRQGIQGKGPGPIGSLQAGYRVGAGYAVERRKRRNGPLQVPAEGAMFLETACSVPTGHK